MIATAPSGEINPKHPIQHLLWEKMLRRRLVCRSKNGALLAKNDQETAKSRPSHGQGPGVELVLFLTTDFFPSLGGNAKQTSASHIITGE
jgi:hypothetical protein